MNHRKMKRESNAKNKKNNKWNDITLPIESHNNIIIITMMKLEHFSYIKVESNRNLMLILKK